MSLRQTNPSEAGRQASWECYWMVFYQQSRLETFQNIRKLGFDRRQAAEIIHDCEREG